MLLFLVCSSSTISIFSQHSAIVGRPQALEIADMGKTSVLEVQIADCQETSAAYSTEGIDLECGASSSGTVARD